MTVTVFGYLLALADCSLLLTAYFMLYLARLETRADRTTVDYLGSLQADGVMAQTPSNISKPEWIESRRIA